MTAICECCLWSFKPKPDEKRRQCRRFPPTIYRAGNRYFSGWPEVFDNDFCGEWQDEDPGEIILPPEQAAELDEILAENAKQKWAEEEAAILSDLHAERAKL